MKLNEAINNFEIYLKADSRSPHTIRSYLDDLHTLQSWLGNDLDIAAIDSHQLNKFLASNVVLTKPNGSPRAKGSVNKIKTSLKAFFVWLFRIGIIPTNPTANIRIKFYQRALPDILTEIEQKQLLKTLANTKGQRAFRDLVIYTLLLNTGLRVHELVNIDIADVNLAEKRLTITAKGNQEATRFLNARIRKSLEQYLKWRRKQAVAIPALFISSQKQRLSIRQVQRSFGLWVKYAWINKRLTIHSLRHTFASTLYEKSANLLAVQQALGHRSIASTMIYTQLTEGGLTGDKEWQDIPFLPYDLLRRKWQYYLLPELKKRLPQTKDNAQLINRLFVDNGKGFYVNGESKMTSARYTARYIGRYMGRPALAEYKITRYDGKLVTFWYESHETKKRVYQILPAYEFMKRLADHIPLKGFKMVRHYGLYARRSKKIAIKILAKCKRFIPQSLAFVKELPRRLSYRQRLIATFGQDPLVCPHCKKEMELWRIWHPQYGDIFDLGRDSPAIEPKYEKALQKNQTESNVEKSELDRQLCLFSV